MPIAVGGTLIECDEACMVIIEHLSVEDEKGSGKGYIIQRIDETHCLILTDKIDEIKSKVKERMDKAMGKDVEKDDIDSDLDEVSKYVKRTKQDDWLSLYLQQ